MQTNHSANNSSHPLSTYIIFQNPLQTLQIHYPTVTTRYTFYTLASFRTRSYTRSADKKLLKSSSVVANRVHGLQHAASLRAE